MYIFTYLSVGEEGANQSDAATTNNRTYALNGDPQHPPVSNEQLVDRIDWAS